MSERSNALSTAADNLADQAFAELQKKANPEVPPADGNALTQAAAGLVVEARAGLAAASHPEAASQLAQAATELKQLLQAFEQTNEADQATIDKMLKLIETPGILDLLEGVNPEIIELLRDASGGSGPAASAESEVEKPAEVAQVASSVPATPSAETRSAVAATAAASPENSAAAPAPVAPAETEQAASPFERMSRRDFTRRLVETITADQSNNIFVGLKIDVTHARWLQTAYELRTNPAQMQAEIAEIITNALDISRKAMRTRGVDSSVVGAENRAIAERIAESFADLEQNPEHLRGIAALIDNIKTAPGKGIRRALAGLRGYYNRSVEARVAMMGGRSSAESLQPKPEEEEKAYSDAELARFEQFTSHVRKPIVRRHIAAQLKALEAQNALPDVSGGSAAATAAEALTPAEAARRQAILDQVAEARAMLRDLRAPDADFPEQDDMNPEELIHLLELLDSLQVNIDPKKKNPKKVGDFMPDAPIPEEPEDEEEIESEEESGEKKVGFWERVQFWNKGKREAEAFVANADFVYIGNQLQDQLDALHPRDKNFKNKHGSLVKAQGLVASIIAAEGYRSKTEGIQRDHKAINQLCKELANLGILANKDAAEKVKQDAEAEKKAADAVDNAEISQGKKNWLKKKLKETGEFLRNPAFLLGVASGATTDLVLHLMGADPGNKAWIKVALAGLIGETVLSQYTRGKIAEIGEKKSGVVGASSRGLFYILDVAAKIGGQNTSHFMLGFSGGAVGMHLGHTAFDNLNHNGPTIDNPSVAIDADEPQPAKAIDLDAKPPVVEDDKNEINPQLDQIKTDVEAAVAEPKAGIPAAELDVPSAQEPPAAGSGSDTGTEPAVAAAVASEAAQELNKGTQKWTETIGKWWNNWVAAQEQNADKQDAQAAVAAPPAPNAAAAEPKNPFFTELDEQRAGVDTTANVHDGSSPAPSAEADAPARAASVQVSGENAHETAHATVVAAAPVPVAEQQPQVIEAEVVKFDSEHIWAEAAQITGGDNNRTDFLKDVGVMFDHAGAGNHEHKMGDAVIVITDSVHTAADLQKLHDLHPEAVGFTLPDESLKKLDAFYQEALNTEPAQRNALQQDVIQHFTGGMSGADLADNPRAVEAMLKIAHGETVDGSQHIIGDVGDQAGSAVESDAQPKTAKEILDAAVEEHNLELKHPLVGQGVIDHLMHEVPDNKIDHPELIATFVDGIWDKWVEGCHKLNLDPMQASPKIVDYIKDPTYNGSDPLSVSPVRATLIDYIQHGNSMHGFTMERGDGQTVKLDLGLAHSVLISVDDNPSIGQLMANNGVDSAIGQVNIEKVFGNNAEAYYRQVQNKQTP